MNAEDDNFIPPPWYRQFWPWMIMALPASAVFGGIATIVIAVSSPNALVVDDYYKAGLAINQTKGRQAAARDLGLQGLLRGDGQRIVLQLEGDTARLDADTLQLQIVHATRAELDRRLDLRKHAQDGSYSAELPELASGRWYLHLQPDDRSWEIRGEMRVDGPFQTRLSADG